MKKIFKYLFLILVVNICFVSQVYAGSYSVSLTSTSVTVGNSVTLRISGSGLAGRFNIATSNSKVAALSQSSVWVDDNTVNITVNTSSAGSATITITPSDVADYDGNEITGGKTVYLTVNNKPTQTYTPREKSSNNYLSSLSVDGLTLDKEFDKEVLEYNVMAPEDTEGIKIYAQLADSSASVSGIGDVNVTTGNNSFSIVVTAENGSKRTYTLNVNVKELEPINVNLNDGNFSVVRKRKDLPSISEYFTEKDITIGEDIIPGYENGKLKIDVVGLKSEDGLVNYYIYKDNKYTLYKEYSFNGLVLSVLDKKVNDNYKKTTFTYDNQKITSYQEVKMDIIKNTYALDNNEITGNQFYLFYAQNVETGVESLYQYDAVEKTVQRYNTEILDMYKESSNTYYMYLLIGICVVIGITLFFSLILILKSRKYKKEIKKLNEVNKKRKENKKEDEEEEMDTDF